MREGGGGRRTRYLGAPETRRFRILSKLFNKGDVGGLEVGGLVQPHGVVVVVAAPPRSWSDV